jgi:translation initiation factor IF-3
MRLVAAVAELGSLSGMNVKIRVNGHIRVSEVRVVANDGKEIGVFGFADACRIAQDRSLDLIEIGPTERPSRCCLMDYGRFKYQQRKAQGDGIVAP